MSENLDSIFRRLKKLLSMAEDGRGNPAECAAAASQAAKIMAKYQIDQADVIATELNLGADESFTTADVGSRFDQAAANVKQSDHNLAHLSIQIAKLNDCQAVIHKDSVFGKMIRFRGYKPDVQVCKFTFRYILSFMQGTIHRKKIASHLVQSYKTGFTSAVADLLREAKVAKDLEGRSNSGSTALVVIKENAVGKHFGEVKYTKVAGAKVDADAYAAGHAEGSKMDVLRRGVEHSTTKYKAIA